MSSNFIIAKENQLVLTVTDLAALRQLNQHNAWNTDELTRHLPDYKKLVESGLLLQQNTALGVMTLLSPKGEKLLGIKTRGIRSHARRLDRAYTRLCIQHLGWKQEPGVQYLKQYDNSGRFTAVMTPFGDAELSGQALVVGKLPHGYSASGIKKLIAKFKSNALHKDFFVVIFTTSARRGKSLAEQHSSWLKVIRVVPKAVKADESISPAVALPPQPESFLEDSEESDEWVEEIRQRGCLYGPSWRAVLEQEQPERRDAFLTALECDGVLSDRQLFRQYGLVEQDLQGVPYVDIVINPIHSKPAFLVQRRMFLKRRQYRHWDAKRLAHAAMVAEMRMLLDVPPDPQRWIASGVLGRRDASKPDAIYGDWAIEADTGDYSARVIEKKLEAFTDRGFDQVIWGVTSPRRQQRLQEQYDIRVLKTLWY